jgi:transcriptional regulator with XRE-family HTH domain
MTSRISKSTAANAGRVARNSVDAHIGARLRQRRVSEGWPAALIAKELNIDAKVWAGYERGDREVPGLVLFKASRLLRVYIGDFFTAGTSYRP